MNLVTDVIGWRWVRFGRGWREHVSIAKHCPEIRREMNREAFWRLAMHGVTAVLFIPALALMSVLTGVEWLWRRIQGALPDLEGLREQAIRDAHTKLPLTEIAARLRTQGATT